MIDSSSPANRSGMREPFWTLSCLLMCYPTTLDKVFKSWSVPRWSVLQLPELMESYSLRCYPFGSERSGMSFSSCCSSTQSMAWSQSSLLFVVEFDTTQTAHQSLSSNQSVRPYEDWQQHYRCCQTECSRCSFTKGPTWQCIPRIYNWYHGHL